MIFMVISQFAMLVITKGSDLTLMGECHSASDCLNSRWYPERVEGGRYFFFSGGSKNRSGKHDPFKMLELGAFHLFNGHKKEPIHWRYLPYISLFLRPM